MSGKDLSRWWPRGNLSYLIISCDLPWKVRDLRDVNTSTDEYDEIGVEVLRNKQGLWFHRDEANVHVPIKYPTTMAFQHTHFPCISLENPRGVAHQKQTFWWLFITTLIITEGHCCCGHSMAKNKEQKQKGSFVSHDCVWGMRMEERVVYLWRECEENVETRVVHVELEGFAGDVMCRHVEVQWETSDQRHKHSDTFKVCLKFSNISVFLSSSL